MNKFSKQIEGAMRLVETSPHLANRLYSSDSQTRRYMDAERVRLIRLYPPILKRYLESEEGRLTVSLFKKVWESSGREVTNIEKTSGWIRWRVFLYHIGWSNDVSGEEIIWFGGNGLERYFREGRSNKFQTEPVTATELITRMISNSAGRRQMCEISRPEQVVPFIRLNAMDLVRYLRR